MFSIHWQASVDDDPSYYGGVVFAHYASPCITAANTVVQTYRFTTVVGGSNDYDNWRVIARSGETGKVIWSYSTDYSATLVYPADWTTIYPMGLTNSNTLAFAGGGGTVLHRSADLATAPVTRLSFYQKYGNYLSDPSAFSGIKICTPITGDGKGDIWFGYLVNGSCPTAVANAIGSGGFVTINAAGVATFMPVSALKLSGGPARPSLDSAPAVTANGEFMYGTVSDGGGGTDYIVKLNATTLALVASASLLDPSDGGTAPTINESSASPMIGPDGHLFMGVFRNNYGESHGWMLQFDQNLKQTNASGKQYPVGSFGWDDTAVVVPSKIVPSYKGASTYLILTKYNNYDIGTGNGQNKVAVLDPSANNISKDRQTGIPVMNEILTVLGPTHDAGSSIPGAVREWCINSAAIDVANKSAIINSEDGHVYRWSFVTNSLIELINLQPATSEAYTCTAIGPDGQCYALNNAILFAVGMIQPTGGTISPPTRTRSR